MLTHLGVHLQNITLLLVASSSRQLLIAVVTHFLFHYPQLRYSMYHLSFFQAKEFEISILFFEVLSRNTLQFCAQLTVTTSSCYYQFPCFLYNKTFSHPPPPPVKKSKRYPAVYRRTHRQTDRDTYPPCWDRGGCNNGFASSIHMIPEMYVAFPLPYPCSPASWTLLLPLSVQDSHNISSNDRYHHSLSSLDNNKTGIYLPICLFIFTKFI